jgi:oligosaccharide reducing-end xylanase
VTGFSKRVLLAALIVGVFVAAPLRLGAQAVSADGSGAYATGKYRNLFAENGHPQRDVDAKIEAAYRQLFHGDPQTQAIAFAAGNNANGSLM